VNRSTVLIDVDVDALDAPPAAYWSRADAPAVLATVRGLAMLESAFAVAVEQMPIRRRIGVEWFEVARVLLARAERDVGAFEQPSAPSSLAARIINAAAADRARIVLRESLL